MTSRLSPPFLPNCTSLAAAAVAALCAADAPRCRVLAHAHAAQPRQQAAPYRRNANTPTPQAADRVAVDRHRWPARRRRSGQSGAAEEPHRQGDRQGEGGREIGQRHFQPRAVPAAEGRRAIDGIAAACREQARFRRAGGDHRLRIVLDRTATARRSPEFTYPNRLAAQLRRQYPTADITVVNSRQGRRRRAGNDEAAADRGDRHEAGSRDLAGRHQRRAAQPRSRRDRQAWWRTASRASRPPAPIVVLVDPQYSPRVTERAGKRQQDGEAARQGRRSCVTSASSRASR